MEERDRKGNEHEERPELAEMKELCQSLKRLMAELGASTWNGAAPEVRDVLGSCSAKVDKLVDMLIDGNGGGNGGRRAGLRICMGNPSVRVDDYDGPVCLLKSLWAEGEHFTVNLRFDLQSFSDVQDFIDYFSALSAKVDELNLPFVRERYQTNLEVEFSPPKIIENGT
ncbi:MAG TPA: hypothetical protein ENN68_06270 [Methanomicrobia archaeon]|nr:hypothetical protein [Methanomicrobia archaeon]